MKMLDYYATLEVHRSASLEVIKKAYVTLAKRYHPDTSALEPEQAAQKMAELNEAYGILSDADKRRAYDVGFADTTTGSVYAEPDNQSAYALANEVLQKQCAQYQAQLAQCHDLAMVDKLWLQFQDATAYTYQRLQETKSLLDITQQAYEHCLMEFSRAKNSFPTLSEDGQYVKKQILLPLAMYNKLMEQGVDINQCIKEALLKKLK